MRERVAGLRRRTPIDGVPVAGDAVVRAGAAGVVTAQLLRFIVTLGGMLAPNALIMRAMGWTSFTHLAAAASWAVFSTAIIILTFKRHRRQGWRTRTALAILAGWVVLGAGAVGMNWNARAVIVVLLVLPAES